MWVRFTDLLVSWNLQFFFLSVWWVWEIMVSSIKPIWVLIFRCGKGWITLDLKVIAKSLGMFRQIKATYIRRLILRNCKATVVHYQWEEEEELGEILGRKARDIGIGSSTIWKNPKKDPSERTRDSQSTWGLSEQTKNI